MSRLAATEPRFAVCVYIGFEVLLELHKLYRVLPDDEAQTSGFCELRTNPAKLSSTLKAVLSRLTCLKL